jgi:hypothetical protein
MQKNSAWESGIFRPRISLAFSLCLTALFFAIFSFAAPNSKRPQTPTATTATPTFGHPVISGIGGLVEIYDVQN